MYYVRRVFVLLWFYDKIGILNWRLYILTQDPIFYNTFMLFLVYIYIYIYEIIKRQEVETWRGIHNFELHLIWTLYQPNLLVNLN